MRGTVLVEECTRVTDECFKLLDGLWSKCMSAEQPAMAAVVEQAMGQVGKAFSQFADMQTRSK